MHNIKNIQLLCAEIVERAGSGHPGAAMGLAHFMHILYTEYLVLSLDDPTNQNRDIFVLSNGHACVIQYVMNYLLGFLQLDDLKQYRKLGSRTPGHPERTHPGIEISTGPLGQGVAASLGFAISSKLLGLSKSPHIYCVFGDGCYEEGISQETFSLCSKYGLDNITFIYDFNKVTIDGPTSLSMEEDVVGRFKALRFTVVEADGYNSDSIRDALNLRTDKPKIIILHTRIGKDSELEGNSKAHGAPLGTECLDRLRAKYGAPLEPFYINNSLKAIYASARERMKSQIGLRESTNKPAMAKHGPPSFKTPFISTSKATRQHFADALNSLSDGLPILCGCADLTPSVLLQIKGIPDFDASIPSPSAYLRFGVREHAMFGVANGIAAHSHFIPIFGTFLNFLSYGFPAVRLAAMDKLKAVYALTHDSILLGADGPTHQPIEVLATLRALPGLTVLRPCDGSETRAATLVALSEPGPVALVLTRQAVSEITQNIPEEISIANVKKGAYFIVKSESPLVIIYASGSEVELAIAVRKQLGHLEISVVSFVSFELFEQQSPSYKAEVLDRGALRVSIEALSTFGWAKYSEMQFGLDRFGVSGDQEDVYKFMGFDAARIAQEIEEYLEARG